MRIFAYLLLVLISYGSVYPGQLGGDGLARLPDMFSIGRQIATDILENILAFVPVGAAFAINPRAPVRWRDYGAAAAVAIGLQLAQLWLPARTPAITDALYNIAGLALGAGAVTLVRRAVARASGQMSAMGCALAGLMLLHAAFVLFIVLGFAGRWEQTVQSWEWLANPYIEPYAALLAGGLASVVMIKARATHAWRRRAAFGLALAIVVLALTPVRPGWTAFQWVPFRSLAHGFSFGLGATLTWKLFSFAALAHLLLKLGIRELWLFTVLPGVVLALEIAQVRLGSGTPDITEMLWALLCVAGVVAEQRSHRDIQPLDKVGV